MRNDSRVVVSIEKNKGHVVFVVRAGECFEVPTSAFTLFSLGIGELAEILVLDRNFRDSLAAHPRGLRLFSNGWQSWSFAGELGRRQRVKPSFLEGLNTFVLCPGPRERRHEVLSHFFARLRLGERSIVLVSIGPSPAVTGAPVAFRIDRKTQEISAEVRARGGCYRAGDIISRIAATSADGYFAERDFFRALFAGNGRFDRLAFLGGLDGLIPGGYESWYNHYTRIDEKVLRSDLESLGANDNLINTYYLQRGKPTVFQIDDGWESNIGDWIPHSGKFPGGMGALARDIEAKGLIPGLWVAPFIVAPESAAAAEHGDWLLRDEKGRPVVAGWNPGWSGNFLVWDLSIPDVALWLDSLFERIVDEWGYRFLKLDFLYAGLLEGERRHGGAAWEHFAHVASKITSRQRTASGAPIAWLGCGAPLESSYPHFPLMRIGADTKETWENVPACLVRHQGRPAAKINLLHTLGRSVLDGAMFVNDPDVVFCRTKGMGYGNTQKELIAACARMFASQVMFSDDASDFGDSQEAAFTKQVVALYDHLASLEFGVRPLGREHFLIIERRDRVYGWINLSDRWVKVVDDSPRPAIATAGLPCHAIRAGGAWRLEPRSLTLFSRRETIDHDGE